MLQRAEIMLLDEPTNHLDVKNVAWLVNYLTTLTDVTSVIVSHDSGFLDNVCQSIIHYENRKLKIYKVFILAPSLSHPPSLDLPLMLIARTNLQLSDIIAAVMCQCLLFGMWICEVMALQQTPGWSQCYVGLGKQWG